LSFHESIKALVAVDPDRVGITPKRRRKLTFNYERPYLLTETVQIKGIDSPEGKEGKERPASAAATLLGEDATKQQAFRAEVRMRNFGRGPAVIVVVRCRLAAMT
jgi:hypothetical protein